MSREPGCRVTWEGVVSSLGGVVASSSRPWGQHVGALIGLLTLGCPALLHSLTPIARSYHNRLAHAIAQASSPSTRDALDAHTAKCLLLVSYNLDLMQIFPGTKWTEYRAHCLHPFSSTACYKRWWNGTRPINDTKFRLRIDSAQTILQTFHKICMTIIYPPQLLQEMKSIYHDIILKKMSFVCFITLIFLFKIICKSIWPLLGRVILLCQSSHVGIFRQKFTSLQLFIPSLLLILCNWI